jgi:hypothetical protein
MNRIIHTLGKKVFNNWIKGMIFPITEMHIECIDQTFEHVLHWAIKHPEAVLMFIPQRLEKVKMIIQNCNNPIGLHVHLDDMTFPCLPDYSTQLSMIDNGKKFLLKATEVKAFGLSDFVSGHWNYNYDTFEACEKLGLTKIHITCRKISKSLSYGLPKGLTIIPVHNAMHDYDFLKKVIKH